MAYSFRSAQNAVILQRRRLPALRLLPRFWGEWKEATEFRKEQMFFSLSLIITDFRKKSRGESYFCTQCTNSVQIFKPPLFAEKNIRKRFA